MAEQRIFKSKKNSKFTTVFNIVLQNSELSLAAKGLYSYLASLPEDWIIYKSEVLKHHKNGRSSLETAWAELEKLEYLVGADQVRSDGQFGGKDYIFYDLSEADKITLTDARNQHRPMHDLNTPMHEINNGTDARNQQLLKKQFTKETYTKASTNFESEWDEAFDSLTIDKYKMTFRGVDIQNQLKLFRLKCDNAPQDYYHRDAAGLRTAFQYQLKTAPKSDPSKEIPTSVKVSW